MPAVDRCDLARGVLVSAGMPRRGATAVVTMVHADVVREVCFCSCRSASVSHTQAAVNRKTLTRAKRNQVLHARATALKESLA
jgi:hypothetical protein